MSFGREEEGPCAYPAARFDSNTLAPQGEAVLQGWASVGVVLETEVWEGRGNPPSGRQDSREPVPGARHGADSGPPVQF